jgi:adenylyltransferase/sulfurtransferase
MSFSASRYSKQIKLQGFGKEAQEKLAKAKVLVIGCGGLGCPAITYLAGCGVGNLGLVDHDLVEESNLPRQPLYSTKDIGEPKVVIAAQKAQELNPDIHIQYWQEKLSPDNALAIIKEYDLVLDCTDNYSTRYLINDACVLANKPWIYASVDGWEGQLSVFNYNDGPTYRCVFPEPSEDAISCNELGVVGSMPGLIGTWQANEAIKCITGVGEVLSGELLIIDTQHNGLHKLKVKRNEKEVAAIIQLLPDYEQPEYCAVNSIEISMREYSNQPGQYALIDIREEYEFDSGSPATINMPYALLLSNYQNLDNKPYLLLCEKGKKSKILAEKLRQLSGWDNIYSLAGGIEAFSSAPAL